MSSLRFGEEALDEYGEGVATALRTRDVLVGKLRTEALSFDEEEAGIDSTVGELVRALCYGRRVEGRALECCDEVTEGGELRQLFDGDTRLSRLDEGEFIQPLPDIASTTTANE